MSSFDDQINSLSSKQKLLYELLLAKRNQEKQNINSIKPRQINNFLPLSFGQQRLWFLNQLNSSSTEYNISEIIHIKGYLQLDVLNKSINEIIIRHEILRTTFSVVSEKPVQVIHPHQSLCVPIINIQQASIDDQKKEIDQLVNQEIQKPFDLVNGPLLRFILIQITPNEQLLLCTIHHIITDGWSMGILVWELATIYEDFSKEEFSFLPKLPIQYADFALWQTQNIKKAMIKTQLNYWKQQLHNHPTLLNLPKDFSIFTDFNYQGKTQSRLLSKSLSDSIKLLGQRTGVTLFMTLLASFNTLLYRYTEQDDILIGTPIANRNRTELENLIGFFVNMLIIRTKFSKELTFYQLLNQIKKHTLDAYSNQDIPFDYLVEQLNPERTLDSTPFFQVMFVFQNTPKKTFNPTGLTFTSLPVVNQTSKFDLSLFIIDTEKNLEISIEYKTALFKADKITRMLENFQTLLESIVDNPEQPILDLPILTKKERSKLLLEWNNTQANYPQNKCIHQLFEEQVAKTPEAIAVVFEEQQLTYKELNSRANQLANYLQSLGVKSETIVGIYLERSLEMVIGILGILKAGGAYLPLDPHYPNERLLFMLEDSQVSILLTSDLLYSSLVKKTQSIVESKEQEKKQLDTFNLKVISIDTYQDSIISKNEQNTTSDVTVDNLAYVIYTSGSTGRPKGVLGLHKGLVNRFYWMWHTYPFQDGEICCQKTSLSFVDSIWEIFGSLIKGFPIIIIPDETVKNPHLLVETLSVKQISRIVLVPSLLQVILNTIVDIDNKLPQLKYWITSGEALSLELYQRFKTIMPNSILLNLYGSSEVSADVTWYDTRDSQSSFISIPIGRPIANTWIYILDSAQHPVPIGIQGELYVGGDGLARGYLNLPELNAEKFIANPFGGGRLYRTGDMARYLSDGNIEFLGRIDNQVKIRGFRIELGEIERVLLKHYAVEEAVVMDKKDISGNKRLVGYIVSKTNPNLTPLELRRFLQEQLPEYMIPVELIILESFPLTPNGKTDRRSLSELDQPKSIFQHKFVHPRNTIELQLTQIWEKLLDNSPIGVTDNFFDLGGHSLLAIHLINQIENKFGKKLPLTTLFKATTIEQIANILYQETDVSATCLVPIQPLGYKRPLFCIHPAGGNVLCYYDFARYLGLDQPFYALQALGLDGEQAPYTQIEEMATHYINTLQITQPHGPYLLAGWSFGGCVAFEMAQQLKLQNQEVLLLAMIDTYFPTIISENQVEEDDITTLMNILGEDIDFFTNIEENYNSETPINRIINMAKSMNIIPAYVEDQKIYDLLNIYRNNINAFARYIPKNYEGTMIFFQSNEQIAENSVRLWRNLVLKKLDIIPIESNHQNIIMYPYIEQISNIIQNYIS